MRPPDTAGPGGPQGRRADVDAPEIVEAFEYMQDLLDEGTADFMHFASGDAAMQFSYVHALHFDDLQELDDRYGVVPIAMGPNADEHVVAIHALWRGTLPIPVGNPEGVIEVVSALWELKKPYIKDLEQWEEDFWHDYPLAVPDRETLEIWQWMLPRSQHGMEPHASIALAAGWDDAVSRIIDEGEAPAPVLAELKPAAQAYLDEILEQ